MRIAFVGKGGSGKSTLTASFASYLSKKNVKPVVVFDADLNIHAPGLLGFNAESSDNHLSQKENTKNIKQWLIGTNQIPNLGAFRKTTPPTRKSNIVRLENLHHTPLAKFGQHRKNLSVFAVGTYQEDDIGASCYHNNLAILESILNHADDHKGYIIVDMVAGVDSFAGTLHAQFDLTCLIVEPTKRSIEVYEKYMSLAKNTGVDTGVFVIGNKIRTPEDILFIQNHITANNILGYFSEDAHVRRIDQTEEPLDIQKLTIENQNLLLTIEATLDSLPDSHDTRLKKIWEIHKKYVGQSFITERFGDLNDQIDPEFSFRQVET